MIRKLNILTIIDNINIDDIIFSLFDVNYFIKSCFCILEG